MNKILASSVNPEKLSLTVKGFIVSVVPILIAVVGLTHLNLGASDITALGDGIIVFVDLVAKIIAAAMVIYGIIRKIGVGLGWIKTQQ